MITAQTIVNKIGAKLPGQQMLFPDPDLILRNTPFRATGDREFDRQWLVYWWMYVYVPEGRGLERTPYEPCYKSYSHALWDYFTFVSADGSYVPETNQQCVRLMCYRDQPAAAHVQELELWLPHIKPREIIDKDGCSTHKIQHIKIFEHTLSEYASHYLWAYPELDPPKYELRVGRGSQTVQCPSTSLTETVDFCRQHYWYGKRLDRAPR